MTGAPGGRVPRVRLDLPGPSGREMLAAVGPLRRDPVGWLAAQTARFGPAFTVPMPRPVLIVHDPDAVRRVLIERHRDYGKATAQYLGLAAVTGDGLLAAEYDTWRVRREVLAPAFAPARLERVKAVAEAAGRRWAQRAENTWDDVATSAGVAALEVLLDAIVAVPGTFARLDADPPGEGERVVHEVEAATEALLRSATSPFPRWMPGPARRGLRRCVADLRSRVDALVAGRGEPGQADDVLACLARAVARGAVDAEGVRAELLTQLVAGHETVAAAMTWTLQLLAAHPDVQEALRADGDLARPVLEEALRLYPPAWVITRRALVDDVLAGVEVPAGTLVVVSPAVLHRRPELFGDPDVFDPKRFVGTRPGGVAAKLAQAGAYLPFGAGARQCIGRDVALVQAAAVVRELVARNRVEPGPGGLPLPRARVTLTTPAGARLRFTPVCDNLHRR